MYFIAYSKKAIKDIQKLKGAGLDGKARKLIEVIEQNPFQNPPPYEGLVGNMAGLYSRRINLKHRLVYRVEEGEFVRGGKTYQGTVAIVRMWTHYE
ncbi:MAG: Txe/YoeB family addiction module toxin [Eggerthellaceae bacterium]|nr:Txe/YoeB family addiction module toxin [Eggerthellaceae bacterium]